MKTTLSHSLVGAIVLFSAAFLFQESEKQDEGGMDLTGWEPSPEGNARYLPPGEDLYEFYFSGDIHLVPSTEEKRMIARTLELIFEGENLESNLEELAVSAQQRKSFETFAEKMRKLDEQLNSDDESLAKLLGVKRIPDEPREREWLVSRYRARQRKALLEELAGEVMDLQIQEILRWTPERQGGVLKTVTETPIGTALGLTEQEKETLRTEADKIGDELTIHWIEARIKAESLVYRMLTPEQRIKVSQVYHPGAPGKDTMFHIFGVELMNEFRYDPPSNKELFDRLWKELTEIEAKYKE